ncbi:unnamed protein product, partial [Effrenium voratum]
TGFLTAKDLADLPSDDEEEDSPDSPTANEAEAKNDHKVSFDPSAQEVKDGAHKSQASQRKGTGFLTAKELADLPSEDEEEDSPDSPTANETEAKNDHKVSFDPSAQESKDGAHKSQATQRKGTGFLTAKDLADLPSDDEEEDSPDSPT